MVSGPDSSTALARAALVKALARDLGFHLVGITTADPFPEAEARVLRWLAEGRQGEEAAANSCQRQLQGNLLGSIDIETVEGLHS